MESCGGVLDVILSHSLRVRFDLTISVQWDGIAITVLPQPCLQLAISNKEQLYTLMMFSDA
jgi:hypothetical protein